MRLRLRDTVEAQILPSHLRVISYIWTPQRIWNLEIEVLGAPELHIKIQEGTSFSVEDLTSRRGNQVDWVIHWAQVLKERLLDHIPLSKGNVLFFFFPKKDLLLTKLYFSVSQEWGSSVMLYLKSSGPLLLYYRGCTVRHSDERKKKERAM